MNDIIITHIYGNVKPGSFGELSYNPDATFPVYARKHGLGVPLTSEFDVEGEGATCRVQGFVGGIVFCEVPFWNLAEHMEW